MLTGLASIAWSVILLIVQIAVSLAFVELVILQIYPWIATSALAVLLLSVMQGMIWIIYILTIARWYGRLSYGEGRL